MARKLSSRGITANLIAPSAIETYFLGGAVRDAAAYNEAIAGVIANPRLLLRNNWWELSLLPTH